MSFYPETELVDLRRRLRDSRAHRENIFAVGVFEGGRKMHFSDVTPSVVASVFLTGVFDRPDDEPGEHDDVS